MKVFELVTLGEGHPVSVHKGETEGVLVRAGRARSDKGGYSGTEGQKARNFVKATKLVSAAGAQGPIFWFTLHGNNPDSPGYGLITRDSQDLSRRRLKAFYALRDMPAPGPGTTASTSP
jgi:hypothetical protein